MKTYNKPAASKLVARFDRELKNILMNDLKMLKQAKKHLPMKTYNKPATSKLVARFDNELRNLLMEDLKAFRSKNKFVAANKQAQQCLTAA